MDKRDGKNIGYALAKQLVYRFFVHLILYTLFIIGVGFLCYYWCESQIWQPYDMTYIFLYSIKKNLTVVFLLVLLFGCILISCVHFNMVARLIRQMVQGVDDLYTERVSSIQLSPVLREVEQKLNEIMMNIRNSRQAARETEQRKNEMIIYMAHDLKTPLTSVLGYLSLLQEEKQEIIFQQFFRMDSARSSKNGGSGLGLAIARQIVELHGGKVWCESEKERVRFILWI